LRIQSKGFELLAPFCRSITKSLDSNPARQTTFDRGADEIWVTSSSKEVFPIVELDGAKVGEGRPGPVFHRMYQLYQEFKQKVMRAGKREAVSV